MELKELKNRNLFLTKVGTVFLIYFAIPAALCLYIIIDFYSIKYVYRTLRLDKLFLVFLVASVLMKLLGYLFMNKINKLNYFLFVVDLFCTAMFTLGIYFYLDNKQRQYQISYGHLVIIFCFTLFFNSIIFLVTTAFHNKRTHYYPLYGLGLLTLVTLLSLKILATIWTKDQIRSEELFILFLPLFAWNIYICMNSYFIVNYRADKIKSRQWIGAFFGYFFDIFFLFWKDLFMNISFGKRRVKK